MIVLTDQLSIPEEELRFTASLSGGPGGQHVNKVNTRVTLWFDVVNSPSLSPETKLRLIDRLGNRISKSGMLRVTSRQTRSQMANREAALERFIELLRAALKQEKARKKTGVSQAAKRQRLEDKKQRSMLKRERSRRASPEDF